MVGETKIVVKKYEVYIHVSNIFATFVMSIMKNEN